MLIIDLIGGLGNQMFQYAFGCSLSSQLGAPVKFDMRNLLDRTPRPNFTFRDFELDVFQGPVLIATEADTSLYCPLPPGLIAQLAYRVRRKLVSPQRFIEKQQFAYDTDVLQVGRNTYFQGYWQNEKYFKPCDALIRQAFAFKAPLAGLNRSLADEITATPSVSMHIRRGDYITNSVSNAVHGVCSPAYYRRAVATIQEQVGDIALFVFSDEPEWVKQHLRFPIPTTYVTHNQGKASYEDLRLMSLCSHNIIANSSFSWWGAWLNANTNKIVVAPQSWLQREETTTFDLIPSNWVRL